MGELFSSTMPTADRRAEDGQSSAEQKVSGGSRRWLRRAIGYFEGRVSNRLGLGRLNYKKDARGNPLPATGFELTAREWACLGELVLGQGSYHGRQIVPAAFLREAFAGSAANPSYGLTFWLNRQAPNGREADMERMIDLPWQCA